MKIDLSQKEPMIDAEDLAGALDLKPEQVMEFMRDKAITSRFETGIDEDAGTHRLTFWHGATMVRFTCDDAGTVLKTSRVKSGSSR